MLSADLVDAESNLSLSCVGDINQTLSLSVSSNISDHMALSDSGEFSTPLSMSSNGKTNESKVDMVDSTSRITDTEPGRGQSSAVRSTAVVQYCNSEAPAFFQHLERNFNLNTPPPNWLCPKTAQENHLGNLTSARNSDYTSFKMAHTFPDMTDNIDVISDSEIIKKLLKMPFSSSHVSMMVHRVGSTLLLDEFDIHTHLLRKQRDDFSWLTDFFNNIVAGSLQKCLDKKHLYKKDRSRAHLQKRNMLSKFLYHSIQEANSDDTSVHTYEAEDRPDIHAKSLPSPNIDHQRAVLWTFEDIRMLIGTDLPIFGDGTHPCVSLRLCDMKQPINVLTGLDYWLDNLMCNVPELAMCYHLSGIVQNYALMKTEEIPSMDPESQFSPQVVRDVAKNILSFLQSKSTKEGHTYWLFKGESDDVVKLYDLTTLCQDSFEDDTQNPFMVHVGILMYTVARNMCERHGRRKAATIRTLLNNCLILLDKDKHSQIVTSAHYLLSDLYVTDDFLTPDLPVNNESDSEDDRERSPTDSESDTDDGSCSVDVQTLCIPSQSSTVKHNQLTTHPPITGDLVTRCHEALHHIIQGLQCLDIDSAQSKDNGKHTVEEQQECDPTQAIPMHYAPLNKPTPDDSMHTTVSDSFIDYNDSLMLALDTASNSSWHTHSKSLLLKKAAVVYYGITNTYISTQQYAKALRSVHVALYCFAVLKLLNAGTAQSHIRLLSGLLTLAADIILLLAQGYASGTADVRLLSDQFSSLTTEDQSIMDSLEVENINNEYGYLSGLPSDVTECLESSLKAYQQSYQCLAELTDVDETKTMLLKRQGNIYNELGVHYMNRSSNSTDSESSYNVKCLEQADHMLDEGIKLFDLLSDSINLALLHSNKSRLMRLYAQQTVLMDSCGQRAEFTEKEKFYFNKALDHYQIALQCVSSRAHSPDIWDSIQWDLSSTYFTMATLLQDYPMLSVIPQQEVEKQITDLMMKALKFCDVLTTSPRQTTCQYRAATIHHRLASLYHNTLRTMDNEQRRKHLRTLSFFHYDKAGKLFTLLDSTCEVLRVDLERVALYELQLKSQSGQSKIKTLQLALEILLSCRKPLSWSVVQLKSPGDYGLKYEDELLKLLNILQQRLQFWLLHLVKLRSTSRKGKSVQKGQLNLAKEMYSLSLKKFEQKKANQSQASNTEVNQSDLSQCELDHSATDLDSSYSASNIETFRLTEFVCELLNNINENFDGLFV